MSEIKKDSKPEVKEIDYSVIDQGPLYVDPKYKKPGFKYALPTSLPGEIERYQRYGYEVVTSDDVRIGQDKASISSRFGSAVTVSSRDGNVHVLMAISDDLYEKLQAYLKTVANAPMRSLGVIEGIDPHAQYGAITKDGRNL